ncbi:MAG: hypothetical protein RLZZ177_1610, partial [Pseudomonadota bacterium]
AVRDRLLQQSLLTEGVTQPDLQFGQDGGSSHAHLSQKRQCA